MDSIRHKGTLMGNTEERLGELITRGACQGGERAESRLASAVTCVGRKVLFLDAAHLTGFPGVLSSITSFCSCIQSHASPEDTPRHGPRRDCRS